MDASNVYTVEEVAAILKISRFTVYEMVKRGDIAGYRIGRKIRVEPADLEDYIKKSKGQSPGGERKVVKPDTAPASAPDDLIICGQDTVLDILTRHLGKKLPATRVLRNCCGSIDGLMALYRGTVNVATAHLWDSDTDSYNVPYVRRILPGHRMLIISLTARTAGFYVAKGNPQKIHDWPDLTKVGVQFVNRERGCGVRVLLDEKLRVLDIGHRQVDGYDQEAMSHMAVASCVARGEADVGVGTEKVALQVKGIDFIPLQKERYDLIIHKDDADKPYFQALLAILKSESFRREISGMGDYDLGNPGEIAAET